MRSAEMAPVSPPRMEARRATVSASVPGAHPAARSTSSSAGSARSPAPPKRSKRLVKIKGVWAPERGRAAPLQQNKKFMKSRVCERQKEDVLLPSKETRNI